MRYYNIRKGEIWSVRDIEWVAHYYITTFVENEEWRVDKCARLIGKVSRNTCHRGEIVAKDMTWKECRIKFKELGGCW